MRASMIALVLLGCSHRPPAGERAATRELITDGTRKIETYWMKPDGAGPFPAVVFLHGHQQPGPERVGGRAFVDWHVLADFAAAGLVAVAVSQPGYGGSDGPPDYCGPATQSAVRAVLKNLRARPFVDGKRIALEGISRGAVVASMVAAEEPTLAGVVLLSGIYDLHALYERDKNSSSMQSFLHEVPTASPADVAARSALAHVAEIKVPTLILSGGKDPIAPPEQASAFAQALFATGVEVELHTFPNAGHQIPALERAPIIIAFLHRHLGKP
jgi:dipeptidyl aminopeptidase/acylaminoacyl peptidase